jgi:hypothetical protein
MLIARLSVGQTTNLLDSLVCPEYDTNVDVAKVRVA